LGCCSRPCPMKSVRPEGRGGRLFDPTLHAACRVPRGAQQDSQQSEMIANQSASACRQPTAP
jgi:hypothetical protein